ncbi:MAG: hypothetical protein R8M38_01445, partial [Mariprofundaceae bacterium]
STPTSLNSWYQLFCNSVTAFANGYTITCKLCLVAKHLCAADTDYLGWLMSIQLTPDLLDFCVKYAHVQ